MLVTDPVYCSADECSQICFKSREGVEITQIFCVLMVFFEIALLNFELALYSTVCTESSFKAKYGAVYVLCPFSFFQVGKQSLQKVATVFCVSFDFLPLSVSWKLTC